MKKVPFVKWLPFLAAMLLVFYSVPPLLSGTAFEDFSLMIITPAFCIGSGLIFGKIHGWVWKYCVVTAVVFAPTLVLYYTQSDIHYILEYCFLTLMGSLIGYAFHRDKY